MTIQLVRKPPIGKKFDSLRMILEGVHSWDEKMCEFRQAIKFLEYNHNIRSAGIINVYANLVDPSGYPVTFFPDGTEIADHILTVKGPFQSAADFYRA